MEQESRWCAGLLAVRHAYRESSPCQELAPAKGRTEMPGQAFRTTAHILRASSEVLQVWPWLYARSQRQVENIAAEKQPKITA
jgi:hypothetical protein